jgi:hypothetical protein
MNNGFDLEDIARCDCRRTIGGRRKPYMVKSITCPSSATLLFAGINPARDRIGVGMTTRPALSMVVLMEEAYRTRWREAADEAAG